jgi:Holliday junction resolvase RusA-like endonuclease
MRTCLNLPFPPSLNGLFANRKGGRRKSDRYKLWQADATEMLLKQRRNQHKGNVAVNIFFSRPDNRRRDLDNLNKGILDLLVTHKVIVDDSRVNVLHTEWSMKPDLGAYVIVEDL